MPLKRLVKNVHTFMSCFLLSHQDPLPISIRAHSDVNWTWKVCGPASRNLSEQMKSKHVGLTLKGLKLATLCTWESTPLQQFNLKRVFLLLLVGVSWIGHVTDGSGSRPGVWWLRSRQGGGSLLPRCCEACSRLSRLHFPSLLSPWRRLRAH